jgi:hypothetical protein
MSFAFKTPPAKPAFGEFREPQDAGEYILKKKALVTFCNSTPCKKGPTVSSQGEMLLLNDAKLQKATNEQLNTNNLNINLITTLDLSGCCTVQSNPSAPNEPSCSIRIPSPTNLPEPFYINHTIDPNGCLFGQTLCTANNYLNFRVYTNPTSNNSSLNNLNNSNNYNNSVYTEEFIIGNTE